MKRLNVLFSLLLVLTLSLCASAQRKDRIEQSGAQVRTDSQGNITVQPATGQSVTIDGSVNRCVDAGSSDAYSCAVLPAVSSYSTGLVVNLKANTANTGPASLNLNGLGVKTIKKNKDADLADNDIKAGQLVTVIYDGTNFQMLSPVSNAAGGGITNSAGANAIPKSDGTNLVASQITDNGADVIIGGVSTIIAPGIGAMRTIDGVVTLGDYDGAGSGTEIVVNDTGEAIQLFANNMTIGGTASSTVLQGQFYSELESAGNTGTSQSYNWNRSNVVLFTLTGNCTFTFTNPKTGAVYTVMLKQDATGSRTVTWPAAVLWPGGVAPTLTTTANKVDIFTLVYDGGSGKYYGRVYGQNY